MKRNRKDDKLIKNILHEKKEKSIKFLLEFEDKDVEALGGHGADHGKGLLGRMGAEIQATYGVNPFPVVGYGNLMLSTALTSALALAGIPGKTLAGLLGGDTGLQLYNKMEQKIKAGINSLFPDNNLTQKNLSWLKQSLPTVFLANPLLGSFIGLGIKLTGAQNNLLGPFSLSSLLSGKPRKTGSSPSVDSSQTLREYVEKINRRVLPGILKMGSSLQDNKKLKQNIISKLTSALSDSNKINIIKTQVSSKKAVTSKQMTFLDSNEYKYLLTILPLIKDETIPTTISDLFSLTHSTSFILKDPSRVEDFFNGVIAAINSIPDESALNNQLEMYKAAVNSIINNDISKIKKSVNGSNGKISYNESKLRAFFEEARATIQGTSVDDLNRFISKVKI
jgi:hypothetical protein